MGVESDEHQEALLSSFYATDDHDGVRRAVSCDCLAHRHGNAADRPVRLRAYPTDMTDARVGGGRVDDPGAGVDGRSGRPAGGLLPPGDARRGAVCGRQRDQVAGAARGFPLLDRGVPVLPALA